MGRVIEQGRRSGLRLKNEIQVLGLSCDDGPKQEEWKIGLKKKLGDENVKLLLEYTTQEDIGR
jgi:hypothetical protein